MRCCSRKGNRAGERSGKREAVSGLLERYWAIAFFAVQVCIETFGLRRHFECCMISTLWLYDAWLSQ